MCWGSIGRVADRPSSTNHMTSPADSTEYSQPFTGDVATGSGPSDAFSIVTLQPQPVESPHVRPFYCDSFHCFITPIVSTIMTTLVYHQDGHLSCYSHPSAQTVRTISQPASSAQRATVSFSISSPGRPSSLWLSSPPRDLVTANGILTYTSEQPLNTLHPNYHSVNFSLFETAFSWGTRSHHLWPSPPLLSFLQYFMKFYVRDGWRKGF